MFLTSCSSSNPTAALLRMKKKTNVERKLTGLSFNHFHIAHTSSANEQRYTIFVSLVGFCLFFHICLPMQSEMIRKNLHR